MTSFRAKGFTLVELLVGLFLFMGISTGFLFFFQSTKKDVEFTTEHFASIILSQKMMEDLAQEIAINPHGFTSLGIDGPSGGPVSLVDGSSIFFSSLEDRKAPWFSIDPNVDGKLDESFGPLYSQIKDFQGEVKAARLAPALDSTEKKNLYQADVFLSWKARTGSGKSRYSCYFAAPISEKKVESTLSLDENKVEEEICKNFYLDPANTFPALLVAKGGDEATIKALGKIYVAGKGYFESPFFKSALKKTQNLEAKRKTLVNNPGYELASCCRSLAGEYYELARSSYQLMVNLEPCFQIVMANYDKAHLGAELWADQSRILPAFSSFKQISDNFTSSLFWTRVNLENLLESQISMSLGSRRQLQTILKIIDLYKLLWMCPNYPKGKDELAAFLAKARKMVENRNPSLIRFISQEAGWANDKNQMLSRYSNLASIQKVVGQNLSPILTFMQKNGGRK